MRKLEASVLDINGEDSEMALDLCTTERAALS